MIKTRVKEEKVSHMLEGIEKRFNLKMDIF